MSSGCPLQIESIEPVSDGAHSYDTPLGWRFKINVAGGGADSSSSFDVVFQWMALKSGEEDVLLDEFEIESLPAGMNEFELEHDMPDLAIIPIEELIASHGIAIRIRYKGEFVAFRGAEVVISYKDPAMEENLPDEIVAGMLLRRTLPLRGSRKRAALTAAVVAEAGQVRERQGSDGAAPAVPPQERA